MHVILVSYSLTWKTFSNFLYRLKLFLVSCTSAKLRVQSHRLFGTSDDFELVEKVVPTLIISFFKDFVALYSFVYCEKIVLLEK